MMFKDFLYILATPITCLGTILIWLSPLIGILLLVWAIENWIISLPIIIAVSIGVICLRKLLDYYQIKKWKRERELERQAACEFCKNHPELKDPINYKIIPFPEFCKSDFKWHKYGKGILKKNGNNLLSVTIYDILYKSASMKAFQSMDIYSIPVFEINVEQKNGNFVKLKDSEIICVNTKDGKRHLYINPILFSKEESDCLLRYEQLYPKDAKECFPYNVEILNTKDFFNQTDDFSLERYSRIWGIRFTKNEDKIIKFFPLLKNLTMDSLPSDSWEFSSKQPPVYIFHFGYYQIDTKNTIKLTYKWEESKKIFIDSDIIFKFDLAFTV